MNIHLKLITTSLLFFGLSSYAQAATINLDFTGECDDCAFTGTPGDVGFNPLNDGLTETVTGRLTITDVDILNGMFDYRGVGDVTFTYDGSSLINPFTMGGPYVFSPGLLTNGTVANGYEFMYYSTQNLADPNNPVSFVFPNFCTPLGKQVLGGIGGDPGDTGDTGSDGFGDACNATGDIRFKLDSADNWSISGLQAFDIGSSGQLVVSAVPVPAAAWLFGSALIGLVGIKRKK